MAGIPDIQNQIFRRFPQPLQANSPIDAGSVKKWATDSSGSMIAAAATASDEVTQGGRRRDRKRNRAIPDVVHPAVWLVEAGDLRWNQLRRNEKSPHLLHIEPFP
jgi:hypothetical protein